MGQAERRELIQQIETTRESRVITYITGDRSPVTAQVSDDALRPLYEQLREMGHVPRIDLFIYSRGGAIDVPWRVVNAIRRYSDEWNVLVPYRANSAATLIALGADSIVLGPQGELGPIDPQLNVVRPGSDVQEAVSVEDVMAYVKFVQERAGLSEQTALTASLAKLTDRLDAVVLGNVYRTHTHIRDVARRILQSRKAPPSEEALTTIVQTLAEKVYAHGHAIGMKDAQDIGLPVKAADATLDTLMWRLLGEYETHMKLREPLDPAAVVAATDFYSEDATIGMVESRAATWSFAGKIEVRAKRQMPQALTVNVALNLQLPPTIDVAKIPQSAQQLLQELMQQAQQSLVQQAQHAVQQALKNQAPLVGAEYSFREGRWRLES
ncbi:MAG: hypothetical protein Q7S20_11755 [Gemmatimonadaceae bacterium]|nr:hypothetical protein [Gemmatimonadaceae bacterium]